MNKIAIMPIQPRYAEAILNGEKTVEFRRRTFGDHVRFVLIYASSPVQKVVGFFEIDEICRTSPSEAWKLFQNLGSIDEQSFLDYYNGTNEANAIKIKKVKQFQNPLELNQINQKFLPPQSYRYVSADDFERVRAFA